MKKITLLVALVLCGVVAFYLYVDTTAPAVSWGVEENASINQPLNVKIADDIGLDRICFTLSGGSCAGEERCLENLQTESYELLIEPDQCSVNSEPLSFEVTLSAVDSSLVANTTERSIKLTYDEQAPTLSILKGSLSLKRGGTGVVLYQVGEVPAETGVILDELVFRAFAFEQNKYLSFYVHPYDVAADEFKPRVFAVDAAGNLRKVRPGSRTASHTYRSDMIELTDDFLESGKDKMMAGSAMTPLEAFVKVNNELRQENYRKIAEICQTTEAEKLWEGVFLRNQGATRAGFADSRTYRYAGEVVSQQVHLGLDIAGINNTPIFAANHGRVIFVGEIGIYGNVVVLDHGYGLHSLYGHLNQTKVQEGELVKKGDLIAVSGETGLAFGDHLHYEMRVNAVPVNPIEWFDAVWVGNNIEAFMPAAEE